MKKFKVLFFVLLILSFFSIGCKMTPVPYPFAENNTASITLNRRTITLINLDGEKLPRAQGFTYWSPIIIPAGKKLNFRLSINDFSAMNASSGGGWAILILPFAPYVDVYTSVSFYCPPLDAGREYDLSLRNGFATFGRRLVLTDKQSGAVVYEQMF